jgi:hypothetical protein
VRVQGQLKGKGISAFSIHNGQTVFYAATPAEIAENTAPRRGSTLHCMADGALSSGKRMMKCIVDQGLPAPSNPMCASKGSLDPTTAYCSAHGACRITGNLFLMLNIVFPTELTAGTEAALRAALPPPLNIPTISEEEAEVHDVGSEVTETYFVVLVVTFGPFFDPTGCVPVGPGRLI